MYHIIPASPWKILFYLMYCKLVAINGRYTHSSLPLFHVRNELEDRCPEVNTEILQFTIRDPYYEVVLRISEGCPDAIFFTTAVWNSVRVEKLISDLHALMPSSLLVVGGPQAEVVFTHCGKEQCTVVHGAIEAVGDKFYEDLTHSSLEPEYGGAFFHMGDRGDRFKSPYRESDFSSHLENRNIYYESSRGCPFSCSYCLSSAENGTLHKKYKQVQTELDQIMAHTPKVLRFVDRTFNDLPERALALWQLVLTYEGDTLFHFEIAPDRISEEMFDFLATVPPGRFQFEIGIQSTHQPTLAAINRKIDPAIAHATVSRLAAMANIHLHADLILGLPFETEESYLHSFADIFAMAPHYIQMGLLKILPDTAISRDAQKYEYVHCAVPPYAILANKWLDGGTLQQLYWFSECVEKFCNNRYFPSLWDYLRHKKEDITLFFKLLLQVSLEKNLFQLAATQELLCSIIVEAVVTRQDKRIIQEFLIYDWLRCGQKNLPSVLGASHDTKRNLRDQLYQQLPEVIEGLYTRKERNRFFKQTVFHQFSQESMQQLGFANNENGCLAFLLSREKSLERLQNCVLLPA